MSDREKMWLAKPQLGCGSCPCMFLWCVVSMSCDDLRFMSVQRDTSFLVSLLAKGVLLDFAAVLWFVKLRLKTGLGRSAKWKCPSLISCLPRGRLLHIKWVCCYWFWMPCFWRLHLFLDVSVTIALWCNQCCKLQIEGKSWLLKGWDATMCFLIWKQIPAEVRSLVLMN